MYRENEAMVSRVSVTTGSVMACQSTMIDSSELDWLPSKLSQCRSRANSWMRIKPRKKTGMAYTVKARPVAA